MAHLKLIVPVIAIIFFFLSSCNNPGVKDIKGVHHGIIYYKDGDFAAWPANNGIWTWDNEILVGFVQAKHTEKSGHTYDHNTASYKYARSKDGGLTWAIEDAYEKGITGYICSNPKPRYEVEPATDLRESLDFTHPDFAMTFLRASNDTGPSCFYYSYNRGNQWYGPYNFPDFETPGVAARTDYIVYGKHELLAFLTVAKSNKKEGRVLSARTTDGGLTWEKVSWIGGEPEGFDIMPSSVRLSSAEILTVIRSKSADEHSSMTSYRSEDNGTSWTRLTDPVADTGGHNGNPPALLKLQDGRLALGYIYRDKYGSRVCLRFSLDNGTNWDDEIMLRSGDGANFDVGYPRMVQRPDGKLVLVYYWNNSLQEGAKPYRYIAFTTIDPQVLK